MFQIVLVRLSHFLPIFEQEVKAKLPQVRIQLAIIFFNHANISIELMGVRNINVFHVFLVGLHILILVCSILANETINNETVELVLRLSFEEGGEVILNAPRQRSPDLGENQLWVGGE